MKIQIFAFASLSFLAFAACNYTLYGHQTPESPDAAFNKALSSDQVPSFEFIKSEILAKNNTCTECHKWANDYSEVRNYIVPGHSANSQLLKKLKNFGGDMPKNKMPLSEKAIEILRLWIDFGAAENAQSKPTLESTTTTTLPANPTYADVRRSVFETNCFVCHNPHPEAKAKKYPFQNYENLMTYSSDEGVALVKPGNLEESAMWEDVSTKDMPPVGDFPGIAIPLTPAQIDLIKRWIEQGAVKGNSPSVVTTTTLPNLPATTTTTTAP